MGLFCVRLRVCRGKQQSANGPIFSFSNKTCELSQG